MKVLKTISEALLLLSLVGGMLTATGCKKEPVIPTVGTVTGKVTDLGGTAVSGVSVATSSNLNATTGADGTYTIANVTMAATTTLTFTKKGYLTTSATVKQSNFDATTYTATVNVSMEFAGAKITGKVTDASNGDAALAGVLVSLTSGQTATTGTDGTFSIEDLPLEDYSMTFSKSGYSDVAKTVAKTDFVSNVATVNAQMGAKELLPGLTAEQLKKADVWYYDEYRGGRNGDEYPHWDWSCDFMCTQMTFVGWWEEQNEGTTLQIQNGEGEGQKNPANPDTFDSYVYGSKMITADCKTMTLLMRTHAATDDAPAYFGVKVIDLSEADPKAVNVGETKTLASEDYKSFDFDLSAYVGKQVVIAIGIYRMATGDYWKQLVLRRIAFAPAKVDGFSWIDGTAINDDMSDWKLTKEMVRSTMVNPVHSFTGISPVGGDRDNYADGYKSWRGVNHIAYGWAYMPRYKDTEPFPGEGFIIKTNGGGTAVNTVVPQAYFYSKFAIASGANKLTLKGRTFSSEFATFFKITVIDEDCNVTNLLPVNKDAVGEKAADNCWKFTNEKGDASTPADYATFEYDLSAFNGKNVVVALGVYKGEDNDAESKLAIYSVELN